VRSLDSFPAFYGTRRFITAFQSTPPHPTSPRSILTLFTHLRLGLPSGSFPLAFLLTTYTCSSSLKLVLHAPPISSSSTSLCSRYETKLNLKRQSANTWRKYINQRQGEARDSALPLLNVCNDIKEEFFTFSIISKIIFC
jgi:hypothetical protein